jgi:hypothetical protein
LPAWILENLVSRNDPRLKDCPYFIGPFAPSRVMTNRAIIRRNKSVRENFVGPPKPVKPRKRYCKKYKWSEDIDTSTLDGRREYGRRYYRNVISDNRNEEGHEWERDRTPAEKNVARLESKRRSRKSECDRLTDGYVKKEIKKAFGVRNPPQELIEAKRVEIRINRALKEMVKTPAN